MLVKVQKDSLPVHGYTTPGHKVHLVQTTFLRTAGGASYVTCVQAHFPGISRMPRQIRYLLRIK